MLTFMNSKLTKMVGKDKQNTFSKKVNPNPIYVCIYIHIYIYIYIYVMNTICIYNI